MKVRHKFLITRAAAFAALLVTAGATAVSVPIIAQGDRQLAAEAVSADSDQGPTAADAVELSARL